MPTSNTIDVNNGTADLNISDGTTEYGFLLSGQITESRASGFSAGGGSSGQATYVDAEPFSRAVWENFGGGFGQIMANRAIGGTGMGGDESKFFWSDGHTLRGNILMPGMARDLVPPSVGALTTSPILTASEIEEPHGVLPITHPNGPEQLLTASAGFTFQRIRVLVKFSNPNFGSNITITGTLTLPSSATFTATISQSTYANQMGFKWITLVAGAPVNVLNNELVRFKFTATANSGVVFGGYAGFAATNFTGGSFVETNNALLPYVQIVRNGSTDPYNYWTSAPRKMEQLINGGTYVPVAICGDRFFLPNSPTTAERTIGGTYTASIVFDNKLYVGYSGNCAMWSAAQVAAAGAATSTAVGWAFGPATTHEGKIFFVDSGTYSTIYKWDGAFPPAGTAIISGGIGKANSNNQNPINSIFIHKGLLFIFKPEGVFYAYEKPSEITTNKVPNFIKVVDLDGQGYEHPDNGKWVVEHQGVLFFNVRHMIFALTVGGDNGNDLQVLTPPWPWGRMISYNYVNGLASDGQVLYASVANVGVVAYNGAGWHHVTDFYDTTSADSTPSALRFLTAPADKLDYLYVADSRALLKIPTPRYSTGYNFQLFAEQHQNKCFSFITPVWDGDLLNLTKFVKGVILRGASLTFNYKVVGVPIVGTLSGSTYVGNYRTLIEKAWDEGLHRDRWVNPVTPVAGLGTPQVVGKLIAAGGASYESVSATYPSVESPGSYFNHDTFELYGSPVNIEKDASPNDTLEPVKVKQMVFILYGWSASGLKDYSTAGDNQDFTYIESLVVKYLAINGYIPRYSLVLDLDRFTSDLSTDLQSDSTEVNTILTWLRGRAGALSPSTFKFYDCTGAIKTVTGFIQNFSIDTDPPTLDTNEKLSRRARFDILSIEEEYTT